MRKFRFTSGNVIYYLVEAETPEEVFDIAVTENPNTELSVVYAIEEEGSEILYGRTRPALEKLREKHKPIDNSDIIEYDIVC